MCVHEADTPADLVRPPSNEPCPETLTLERFGRHHLPSRRHHLVSPPSTILDLPLSSTPSTITNSSVAVFLLREPSRTTTSTRHLCTAAAIGVIGHRHCSSPVIGTRTGNNRRWSFCRRSPCPNTLGTCRRNLLLTGTEPPETLWPEKRGRRSCQNPQISGCYVAVSYPSHLYNRSPSLCLCFVHRSDLGGQPWRLPPPAATTGRPPPPLWSFSSNISYRDLVCSELLVVVCQNHIRSLKPKISLNYRIVPYVAVALKPPRNRHETPPSNHHNTPWNDGCDLEFICSYLVRNENRSLLIT